MATETPARLTLTEAEAARYLQDRTGVKFSKQMVKLRRLAGTIPGHKIGRAPVYKAADLDRYLEGALTPTRQPEPAAA